MTPSKVLEYDWLGRDKRTPPDPVALLAVDDKRVIKFERLTRPGPFGDVSEARVFLVGDFEEQLPRRYVKHSPTGFEWGYGGSGPADTALNILALLIPVKEVTHRGLYQHFKEEFVARVPRDGGEIRMSDVRAWLARHITEEAAVAV